MVRMVAKEKREPEEEEMLSLTARSKAPFSRSIHRNDQGGDQEGSEEVYQKGRDDRESGRFAYSVSRETDSRTVRADQATPTPDQNPCARDVSDSTTITPGRETSA